MNKKLNCRLPTIVHAAIYLIFSSICALAQSGQQPQTAPAVIVDKVSIGSSSAATRYNAQVEAIEAVDIQARVTGFVKAVVFTEGQAVKAGDLLFEIEPDQMAATLASAEAQVARAEASQNVASQTLTRTRNLFNRNTASQAALDDAQAAFDTASADLQNAKANRTTAQLNLSYTRVTAPISGTIGRSVFTTGNLVGPNNGALARIVQLDPVRVVFSVPDRVLVGIRQKQASGRTIDPNSLKLSLTLANGTEYDQRGTVQFIDNEVSSQTGTVAVRALFPNPDHILLPGQFVSLRLLDDSAEQRPLVPMASVSQDRQGKFVFALNEDNTVSRRDIQTGARIGNSWSVTDGLEGGEIIVVEGTQRISDGGQVTPRKPEATTNDF